LSAIVAERQREFVLISVQRTSEKTLRLARLGLLFSRFAVGSGVLREIVSSLLVLQRLSSRWAALHAQQIEEILRKHPYNDH
jgi:hypothetical protein